MDIIDIVLASIIAGFAVFLLYRSMWKKRGKCSGCEVTDCNPSSPTDCEPVQKPGK